MDPEKLNTPWDISWDTSRERKWNIWWNIYDIFGGLEKWLQNVSLEWHVKIAEACASLRKLFGGDYPRKIDEMNADMSKIPADIQAEIGNVREDVRPKLAQLYALVETLGKTEK